MAAGLAFVAAGCGGASSGDRSTAHRRAPRSDDDFRPGPRHVLLIVNEASPASTEIGAYYATKRALPPDNVCRLSTAVDEEIDRDVYDREIEAPVAECLRSKGLINQVLYLTTTLGVPLKIRGTSGQAATGAAVDSELTLLYAKLQGTRFDTAGPQPNPLFGRRSETFGHPRFPLYLVTRLAAYDVAGVKAMIDRALEARNRGVVVLDLKSTADTPGDNWLRTAALLLPEERLDYDESSKVIRGAKDVIGYGAWGSNDEHRKDRWLEFEWLPGAIATEYVSTDGRTFERPPAGWSFGKWDDRSTYFGGSPQGLTADLIEEGATGAAGHVYEPFLTGTPRPDYLFPAYLSGRTLAESYYLAIPSLSWMNIVVGDPLCRLAEE